METFNIDREDIYQQIELSKAIDTENITFEDLMGVFKMRLDGSGRTTLVSFDTICTSEDDFLDVFEDWVYYNESAREGSFCKVRTDGTERQQIE